jgi:type I restriction enzyme S subunit
MPYIRSSDLNFKLKLGSLARTSEEIARRYRRSEVGPGDLVFSLRGNIGASQIVPNEIRVANLTQGTARIRTRGPSGFYLHALRTQLIQDRILAVSKGSTFQEISLDDLRKVQVHCPELDEQKRIADCLSSLDDLIAAETRKFDALRIHKKGLMQQIFPRVGETDT